MGNLFSKKEKKPDQAAINKAKAQEQVHNVDVVKSKLKVSRDKVNNIIKAKNLDIDRIDAKIKEELPAFQETNNKKKMVPLLKAKKDLQTFVDNADVRLKLLNEKLSEVELQQVNAETINALEDSNKYIKEMQDVMEKKDWQGIIDEAKNKCELDWPQDEEDLEDDPTFQEMWKELGGDKIEKKAQKKVDKKPAQKEVSVEVPKNTNKEKVEQDEREVSYA